MLIINLRDLVMLSMTVGLIYNLYLWVILAALSCDEPENLRNGYKIGHDFTFMKTVHYWCHPGYDLSGNRTRTCTASGTWTGSTPSCVQHYHHSKYPYCKYKYTG